MKKLSQKILIVSLVITLLFIWINSMLPGDLSGRESAWVQSLLGPVLDYIRSGRIQASLTLLANKLPERLCSALIALAEQLDRHLTYMYPAILVRKAAHFTEYMVLGFLMGLQCVRKDGRSRFWMPELLCLAAALIDEGIQYFSPGRVPQLRDVCLDMCGVTLGLTVTLLLLSVLRLWYRESPEIGKIS